MSTVGQLSHLVNQGHLAKLTNWINITYLYY